MDARVDGVPVTPRAGKPVEVNALWVNGLAMVIKLAWQARTGRRRRRARPPGGAGLVRAAVPGRDRAALRRGRRAATATTRRCGPNQLLAWSLPYAPLRPEPAALQLIGAALMTPLGPRSQAPGDARLPGPAPRAPAERDPAYHTGTVWPWLTGPYVAAWHRLGVSADQTLSDADGHLGEYGLGSVSETADADAPHGATGCPFQAWSVAESLRARRLSGP